MKTHFHFNVYFILFLLLHFLCLRKMLKLQLWLTDFDLTFDDAIINHHHKTNIRNCVLRESEARGDDGECMSMCKRANSK